MVLLKAVCVHVHVCECVFNGKRTYLKELADERVQGLAY